MIHTQTAAAIVTRAGTRPSPPPWTLVYRIPAHLALLAAGAARAVAATLTRAAVSLWESIAGAVTLLVGFNAAGLLFGGDTAYQGPTYEVVRQVPGGMRAYGIALVALLAVVLYGFGQQHLGQGHVLRVALSLVAAWHVGWLVALAGTYAMQGAVYSWSALALNGFAALVTVLVGRAVPPDRG